ncbi:BZ3500_MvSof-1268-A1-R1_Chr3-1g05613 [Microbotryum saponariae]|uniref:BZ3500_MvSof-1268-A1-R1_Chr3-1g05613 protein n=1 Tax=Microbotryum saponariae TaxID=289078 RepID=A0A2X0L060_9BASI|nr:BZ3500_MvSof-1268-A1-R1_Chr3-1g05613 [Microbotryum saponariae]SDA04803.1 BZ3501_MvSof-1269-A2-R1_Chr3-1g05283 [Microbotryum saponariae]
MSKYEGRLVLNYFSKLLYKLYNARNFFCAARRLHSRRARAGKVARAHQECRRRDR